MKNKVNEWQELSLKKDVEKIRRSISEKDVIDYAFYKTFKQENMSKIWLRHYLFFGL